MPTGEDTRPFTAAPAPAPAPAAKPNSDPVEIAETLSTAMETIALMAADRIVALGGDPAAVAILADGFDRLVEVGQALDRVVARMPGGNRRAPRFTLLAGGAS